MIKILNYLSNKHSLFDTVIVSANDALVDLYLKKRIKFTDIHKKLFKLIKSNQFLKYNNHRWLDIDTNCLRPMSPTLLCSEPLLKRCPELEDLSVEHFHFHRSAAYRLRMFLQTVPSTKRLLTIPLAHNHNHLLQF